MWSTLERAPFRVGLNLTRVELKELNVPMRPWSNGKSVEVISLQMKIKNLVQKPKICYIDEIRNVLFETQTWTICCCLMRIRAGLFLMGDFTGLFSEVGLLGFDLFLGWYL